MMERAVSDSGVRTGGKAKPLPGADGGGGSILRAACRPPRRPLPVMSRWRSKIWNMPAMHPICRSRSRASSPAKAAAPRILLTGIVSCQPRSGAGARRPLRKAITNQVAFRGARLQLVTARPHGVARRRQSPEQGEGSEAESGGSHGDGDDAGAGYGKLEPPLCYFLLPFFSLWDGRVQRNVIIAAPCRRGGSLREEGRRREAGEWPVDLRGASERPPAGWVG